ncbi:hypothetical protein E3P91_02464 [Wallemia ichthyophaga]|nr:hypothetical protein E3P91_02464 [Wallemia ichthyophaga]
MTTKFTVRSFYGGGKDDGPGNSKRPIKNINDVISISPFPNALPSSQFSRLFPESHTYISSPDLASSKPSNEEFDIIWNTGASDDEDIVDLIRKQHQLNIQDESLPNIKLPADISISNNPVHLDIGMPNSTANKVQKSIPPLPRSSKPKTKNTSNAEIALSMQDDSNYLYSLRNRIINDPPPPSSSKLKRENAKTDGENLPAKNKESKKRDVPYEANSPSNKRSKQTEPPKTSRNVSDPKSKPAKQVHFSSDPPAEAMEAEKAPPPVTKDDKFVDKIVAHNPLLKNIPKAASSRRTVVATELSNNSIDKHSLKKLKQLINSILETEDSVLMGVDEIPKEYAAMFASGGHLQATFIKDISSCLNQLYASKPNSILELANNDFDGTSQSELVITLARLIKLLSKTVGLGDKLSVWTVDERDVEGCKRNLQTSTESIIAVECILLIMKFDQLPKQLYFEDVLSKCLSVLRHHLTKTVYSYVEAIEEGYSNPSECLAYIAREDPQPIKKQLSNLFNAIKSSLPSLNALMNLTHVSLGDSVLITATYISIGPFFVAEPTSTKNGAVKNALSPIGGGIGLRELRLTALTLMQNIFANYDTQRHWIIDEILSATIKLPELKKQTRQYQLKSGKSIFTLSALLFQLVQACSHSVHEQVNTLRDKHHLNTFKDEEVDDGKDKKHTEFLLAEAGLWKRALVPTISISQSIMFQVFTHISQSKSQKSSHEADYKIMLENIVNDALTVLHLPEWPGASWLLVVTVKLVEHEIDPKIKSPTEVNNIRSVILEHFGNIFAHVRTVELQRMHEEGKNDSNPYFDIERTVTNGDIGALENLHSIHQQLLMNLYINGSRSELCRSAYESLGSQWGYAIVRGLQVSQTIFEEAGEDETVRHNQSGVQGKLFTFLQEIWAEDENMDFADYNRLSMNQMQYITLQLSSTSLVQKAQDRILVTILESFSSNSASIRAKAVKALGVAIMSDNSLLNDEDIKRCISSRVGDVASSVRDAALDVLSKHLAKDSGVADAYFTIVSRRIDDSSPAVRKRVAKLLRDIYESTTSLKRKAEIAKLFCLRIADEDDLLKDAALDALDKLWLDLVIPKSSAKEKAFIRDEKSYDEDDQSKSINDVVEIIMMVTKLFGDRYSLFEEAMLKLVKRHPMSHNVQISTRLKSIANSLVDRLDMREEDKNFSPLACVRAILVISGTGKGVVGGSAAEQLLPLLTNGRSPEERAICEATLKIFRKVIPRLPIVTSMRLTDNLQNRLLPLIANPNGRMSELSEAVACLCHVVTRHTNSYVTLTRMLLKAVTETKALLDSNSQTKEAFMKCRVLIIIMSLLVQHCDFDDVKNYDDMHVRERARQQYFNAANDLDEVDKLLVFEHTDESDDEREFTIPVRIWVLLMAVRSNVKEPSIRALTLRGLGCLFVGYPYLMNDLASIQMMDEVFGDTDTQHKSDQLQLLLVFQEYLRVDELKKNDKPDDATVQNKEITVDNLIGDADVLNDSNVGPRVLTRYLRHILDAALSTSAAISAPAIDILGFVVKQGLTHPIELLPALVALETSTSGATVAKAKELHATLHSKHASVLNTQYLATVEKAFQYHRLITGQENGFRNDVALLETWFDFMKEKRLMKLDFLGGIVKHFDMNPLRKAVSDDSISMSKFVADNLLAFSYQNNEEVLCIGKMLSTYLATHGEQLRDELSFENINETMKNMIRSSVVFSICTLLKSNLRDMYGFTDKQFFEYNPKKKTSYGDKALAIKTEMRPIEYGAIPGAAKIMSTKEDFTEQIDAYFNLIDDSPTTGLDDDAESMLSDGSSD